MFPKAPLISRASKNSGDRKRRKVSKVRWLCGLSWSEGREVTPKVGACPVPTTRNRYYSSREVRGHCPSPSIARPSFFRFREKSRRHQGAQHAQARGLRVYHGLHVWCKLAAGPSWTTGSIVKVGSVRW